ncbi:MAG TPA: hypothetical protein VEY67_02630 [Candidatus Dormibacteraeota bacterium]|nr:hypothetical protein [Candidatus Dormibacteraeota bacterium]
MLELASFAATLAVALIGLVAVVFVVPGLVIALLVVVSDDDSREPHGVDAASQGA